MFKVHSWTINLSSTGAFIKCLLLWFAVVFCDLPLGLLICCVFFSVVEMSHLQLCFLSSVVFSVFEFGDLFLCFVISLANIKRFRNLQRFPICSALCSLGHRMYMDTHSSLNAFCLLQCSVRSVLLHLHHSRPPLRLYPQLALQSSGTVRSGGGSRSPSLSQGAKCCSPVRSLPQHRPQCPWTPPPRTLPQRPDCLSRRFPWMLLQCALSRVLCAAWREWRRSKDNKRLQGFAAAGDLPAVRWPGEGCLSQAAVIHLFWSPPKRLCMDTSWLRSCAGYSS